ncbi:hypothetical protein MMC08_007739 [Hypocenomyce scalaris]|nr:hypothetical protein [Hypocenomyce scalaris]
MDKNDIEKSILSVTAPGIYLEDQVNHEAANLLARRCNDEAAQHKKDYPERFGFFAVLPVLNPPDTLAEIKRCIEHLDADGFVLETNFRGHYLGDERFQAIMAELNARKATIFIHPTVPARATPGGHQPAYPFDEYTQYPLAAFEFQFDSARALINLLYTNTVFGNEDITWIMPHAGGTFVATVNRMTIVPGLFGMGTAANVTQESVKRALLDHVYWDLAGFPFPDQLPALLNYTDSSRILYGSDWPYTPAHIVEGALATMKVKLAEIFPEEEDQEKIYNGNARKLLQKK